ncbi:MAG: hypothetical protein IPP81_15560 [Chitinophagaceae bacterium]|nr:hypothetical protein [Chitinophagaceae bacterium]
MADNKDVLIDLGKLIKDASQKGGIIHFVNSDEGKKYVEFLKKVTKHQEYKDLAALWRGKVLNLSVQLELSMDKFIAYYFCSKSKKRRDEFLNMILQTDGFMLGKKIKLVNRMFKNLKDIGEYKHERVKGYMENVRDTRNAVAHSDINSSEFIINLANKTSVFQAEIKKGSPLILSKNTFDKFARECAYCIDFFDEWAILAGSPLPYKENT